MAVNELAVQDLMASLLAQSPSNPSDPPVEAKVEPPHEDLVLEALGIKPAEAVVEEATVLTQEEQAKAFPTPRSWTALRDAEVQTAAVESVAAPSAVPSFEEKVARFRSLFGGGG